MRRLIHCAVLAALAGIALTLAPAAAAPGLAAVRSDSPEARPAVHLTAHRAPAAYVVQRHDTLSSIARSRLGAARRWQGLWAANRDVLGRNPNRVRVDDRLRLANVGLTAGEQHHLWKLAHPPAPPAPPVQAAPAAPAAPAAAAPSTPAPAPQPAAAAPAAPASYSGGSSFEQCVIAHESGGNAGAVNPSSGAGGLYQFLPSTWASLGYSGAPQDAPVGEQQQAFARLYASQGSSPWAGDGC